MKRSVNCRSCCSYDALQIVKLLKETSYQLEGTEGEGKRPKWLRQLEGGQSLGRDIDAMSDERRMLSRFGVWLMAALCPPTPEAPSVGSLPFRSPAAAFSNASATFCRWSSSGSPPLHSCRTTPWVLLWNS